MKKFVFFLIIIFISSSCKEEIMLHQIDDQGVIIATPYLWKTSLHEKEPASNGFLKFPIMYNDNVLIPTTNGKNSHKISLIDSKDGKFLWRWDDIFAEYSLYNDVNYCHQYRNLLTSQKGSRSFCINMDTGTTHWKYRRDRSFHIRITSFEQYYITYGPITNDSEKYHKDFTSFIGDIETGIISEFITPNFAYEDPEYWRGVQFVNQNPEKDNLFLISYFENLEDYIIRPFFGLYDNDLKEWVWDRVLITPPKPSNVIDWPPIIKNDKIYAVVDNCIVCHNLNNGKQLWKKDFTNNFLFSGFIIEDGMLFANNEDIFMVCLDIETGREIWRVRTAGTGSRLSYLNGIIYYVGGSVPRLFAIEANTGKILWRLNPALLGEEGYGAGFRANAVYVLPAKDNQPAKVIALSNLYAYCFEAYQ